MNDKKTLEEYLTGKSTFSELYRNASQDEQCPDQLSTRVINKAIRKDLKKRNRLWLETALVLTALLFLFIAFYGPSQTPETECPREPIKQEVR